MEETKQNKLVTPASLAVDALLCVGFFLFLRSLVASHVQSRDASMILLWSSLTAFCMTCVFWLAVQMFRVVLRAQLQAARKR